MNATPDSRHASDPPPAAAPGDVEQVRRGAAKSVRLLVALSGGSEDAALVRTAHRLAERDDVRWRAIHVDNGRDDAERRLVLEKDFAMVHRLGGETRVLQGQDRAAELHDYAREHRIATLLVGCSRPSGWRVWRRTLAEQLLRRGGTFDLMVVAEARQRSRFRPRHVWQPLRLREPVVALLSVLGALVVAWGLESWLELANLSLVFLAAVLASATLAGTRAAMLSAGLGFLAFNFFFTQPRFSLAIVEHGQLLTVVFFLLVAVVVGQLAGSGRRRLLALRSSREQTYRLLTYARALSAATDRDQVGDIGVTSLERWLGVPVVLLDRDEKGVDLTIRHAAPPGMTLDAGALTAAGWSWQHRQPSGRGTENLPDQQWRLLPLVEQGRVLGIVGLKLAVRETPPGPDQEALIEALSSQLTMALERTRLVSDLGTARLSEENERLRSALLSSVSHDLRTPLASIIGSASTLRELEAQLSDEDKHELLDGILSESERLNRYIQNLLDMTRLGHGSLKIERDWISLEDLIESAIKRLGPSLEHVKIERRGIGELPLLFVHPALIEQALVNVIDNAARFSPSGGRVIIAGRLDETDRQLEVRVTDEGPGIPPAQRQAVFDMFFTGGEGDRSRYGSGLGLAICRGMLGAHGGSIAAEPGPAGSGTSIVMRLPLSEREEDAQDDG
ncbi:ATP-binding protein [Halomonas chromatireducens]|uniref:histidine kinase n=1 Tax=Halomonas chromatireducens TaxID=507626 RepID=A0A0X8HFE8_9GAMM|nr:ATP-binding protein [Halomonas chromatireducens]AMD01580.1 Sensor protein KdpD [Halomonas chromatireducens]